MILNEEEDELAFLSEEDELDKKLNDPDINLNPKDSLIVVSFRLPLQVTKQKVGEETKIVLSDSRSQLYPSIFRLKDKGFLNFRWVGWPGIYPKDL